MRGIKNLLAAASLCCAVTAHAEDQALNVGDPFPDFSIENTLSKEHSAYLKLPKGKPLQLSAIPHDVIILEFLNILGF